MTKTIALKKISKYVPFQRFYYTHIVSMCMNIRWTINKIHYLLQKKHKNPILKWKKEIFICTYVEHNNSIVISGFDSQFV